jgi:uncharacterized coiled-coil protein SlyX
MKNRETTLEELCDAVADSFSKKELKRLVADALLDEFTNLTEEDLNYYIDEYLPHLAGIGDV